MIYSYFGSVSVKGSRPPMAKATNATDIEGVHAEWDEDTELREFLRGGGRILESPSCQDISTCLKNASMLRPVLTRMSLREKRELPGIDQIKGEIELLLQKNKQGLECEYLDISKRAMILKKLLGFIKNKVRRREVSTATGLWLRSLWFMMIYVKQMFFFSSWFWIFGRNGGNLLCWVTSVVRFAAFKTFAFFWTQCSRLVRHICIYLHDPACFALSSTH